MSTQRENKTTQTYWIHIRLNRRRAATDLFFVGVGKFHTIRSFANAQMHAMAAHTRPQSSLSLHIHPKSRPLGMRIMHSDRLSFAVVRAASYQHVCSRNSRINSLSRLRSHSRISYKLKEEKEKKRTCRRPGERFSCNAMCARWCVCVCVRAIVYTLHWVVSVFRFSSNLFIFLLFHFMFFIFFSFVFIFLLMPLFASAAWRVAAERLRVYGSHFYQHRRLRLCRCSSRCESWCVCEWVCAKCSLDKDIQFHIRFYLLALLVLRCCSHTFLYAQRRPHGIFDFSWNPRSVVARHKHTLFRAYEWYNLFARRSHTVFYLMCVIWSIVADSHMWWDMKSFDNRKSVFICRSRCRRRAPRKWYVRFWFFYFAK